MVNWAKNMREEHLLLFSTNDKPRRCTRTRACTRPPCTRGTSVRVMRCLDPHVRMYDSHWPLHFVGYAFTSMLDLFRGDIDGQAQLIWLLRERLVVAVYIFMLWLRFTRLNWRNCHKFANIAWTGRRPRRVDEAASSRDAETRACVYLYTRIHGIYMHACVYTACARVNVHLGSKRIPMNTD